MGNVCTEKVCTSGVQPRQRTLCIDAMCLNSVGNHSKREVVGGRERGGESTARQKHQGSSRKSQ